MPQPFKKLNLSTPRLPMFGVSAKDDWKFIFLSASTLALLIIILSVFMFIKINKREAFVVEKEDTNTDKTLNLTTLKTTVSYYRGKALEFERIKKEGVKSVDPSL